MREIKFRVWDDIARKMWYPKEGLKACVTQVGSVCIDETDEGGILENRSYRMIALFYTGLQDKNGKEIYEGDIVRVHITSDKDYKVLWRKELMWALQPLVGQQWQRLGCYRAECYEVIGNIYENPELLEE